MKTFAWILTLTLAAATMASAEIVTLKDKKGRSLIVEIIGQQGDGSFKIKRAKDGKVFNVKPGNLSAESQKLLLAKTKDLPTAYPELIADISVSKRRKPSNGSSWWKEMTISTKVTIENKDNNTDCPPCHCNIILVGQNQSNTEKFKVLSNQEFEMSPSHQGTEFSTAPIYTKYDSDNRGEDNSGGYKYVGYLLVVTDPKDNLLYSKTIYSLISKAIAKNANFPTTMKAYTDGTYLAKSMLKRKSSSRSNY